MPSCASAHASSPHHNESSIGHSLSCPIAKKRGLKEADSPAMSAEKCGNRLVSIVSNDAVLRWKDIPQYRVSVKVVQSKLHLHPLLELVDRLDDRPCNHRSPGGLHCPYRSSVSVRPHEQPRSRVELVWCYQDGLFEFLQLLRMGQRALCLLQPLIVELSVLL